MVENIAINKLFKLFNENEFPLNLHKYISDLLSNITFPLDKRHVQDK